MKVLGLRIETLGSLNFSLKISFVSSSKIYLNDMRQIGPKRVENEQIHYPIV